MEYYDLGIYSRPVSTSSNEAQKWFDRGLAWTYGYNLAPTSLARRVATLSKVHAASGWASPCRAEVVHTTLRGIRRVKGTSQHQATPLLREALFVMLGRSGGVHLKPIYLYGGSESYCRQLNIMEHRSA